MAEQISNREKPAKPVLTFSVKRCITNNKGWDVKKIVEALDVSLDDLMEIKNGKKDFKSFCKFSF